MKGIKAEVLAALRQEAELRLRQKEASLLANVESMSAEDMRRIVHELGVFQIELEMQNEELRANETALEAAQAMYFELYDLAPVGYCTLSEEGVVRQANLRLAEILGSPRRALVGCPLTQFIVQEDQDIYYLFRKKVTKTQKIETCELRMKKAEGAPFWVELTANILRNITGGIATRITFNDISGRKLAEEGSQVKDNQLQTQGEQSLLQSVKMASFSEMAAGMVHGLSAPLDLIESATSSLKQNMDLEQFLLQLQKIREATGQCKKIVNELGKFSNNLISYGKCSFRGISFSLSSTLRKELLPSGSPHARQLEIHGYFEDEDALKLKDILVKACDLPTFGRLIHPLYGYKYVNCVSKSFEEIAPNQWSFSLIFKEVVEPVGGNFMAKLLYQTF